MNTDFKLAEVIDTSNTFTNSDNNEFDELRITVRTISDVNVRVYENVRPANLHDLSIPIPGEHVLIFEGIRQESDTKTRHYDWYYLTTYALQATINNNLLPGVTYITNNSVGKELSTAWKKQISEKIIVPLQPYPGDRIIQGRWGNRFRFGSTLKTQDTTFSKQPTWSKGEGTDGDPIIILSNTKLTNDNTINVNGATVPTSYQVENLNSDYSSLYLTSTQELSGYTVKKSWPQENKYKSQFIGVADRINLNAKTDSVTINAPNNIELNTDIVVFGTSTDKEPGIHSTELKEILDLITQALAPVASIDPTVIDKIAKVTNLILRLDNKKIQQDKRIN